MNFTSVLRQKFFVYEKNARDDNSALVLVLPYATSEYLNNEESFCEYYSDVEISHAASVAHPKSAIQIRNREMVDRADLVICYGCYSSNIAPHNRTTENEGNTNR